MRKLRFKKVFFPLLFIFIAFVTFQKCSFHPLPKERLSFATVEIEESFAEDAYQLTINNPVACPMRFYLSCDDPAVNQILGEQTPLLLEAKPDSVIRIQAQGNLKGKINKSLKWGNPELPIRSYKVARLPF